MAQPRKIDPASFHHSTRPLIHELARRKMSILTLASDLGVSYPGFYLSLRTGRLSAQTKNRIMKIMQKPVKLEGRTDD